MKSDAGSILGRQTNVGFDDSHLALFDNQHRDLFDAYQERVQVVCAVEKRVVLKADFATGIQELLEILVVVVQVVLAAKDQRP